MSGNDVSTFRRYLLRLMYLFIAAGLGITIWPGVIHPPAGLEHMRGVVRSVLAGVSLMALLGLRYPVRMLPLLLFEVAWKTVWVVAFGLPRWWSGTFDAGTRQTWYDCLVTLPMFVAVIPWGHVWRHYVRERGERWMGASGPAAGRDAGGNTAHAVG